MLGLKLNHISKRGPWNQAIIANQIPPSQWPATKTYQRYELRLINSGHCLPRFTTIHGIEKWLNVDFFVLHGKIFKTLSVNRNRVLSVAGVNKCAVPSQYPNQCPRLHNLMSQKVISYWIKSTWKWLQTNDHFAHISICQLSTNE